MKRVKGFTLIELLVVIAIIAILAGIMGAKIGPMIAKARMARAETEIGNIELALTSMLADANKKSFRHMWTVTPTYEATFDTETNIDLAMKAYENAFYLLLRLGSAADQDGDWPAELTLRPDVTQSIGKNYMDLGNDPWGQKYQFCPGPLRYGTMPFRVYNRDESIPGLPNADGGEATYEDIDTNVSMTVGFPASKNMTVYIFSKGQNLEWDQFPEPPFTAINPTYNDPNAEASQVGGGDDIVSWDEGQSYHVHYN